MVEIDDAGSGSLIGGTGIGILKKDTQEYFFDLIPLNYFQPPHFNKKTYQDYVINIIQHGFQKLNIDSQTNIYLCSSYIFDRLRQWLSKHGYRWKNKKIVGPLQHQVEASFTQYVIKLGLPTNFIKHARYAFSFHRLFKWVMADFKTRALLCKTGWPSWQKWSTTIPNFYSGKATKKGFCLKCGKLIYPNDPVCFMEYHTNKLWTLGLHPDCVYKKDA